MSFPGILKWQWRRMLRIRAVRRAISGHLRHGLFVLLGTYSARRPSFWLLWFITPLAAILEIGCKLLFQT
jgi:hypothetical protein